MLLAILQNQLYLIDEALGIADFLSIRYYKEKQSSIQHNLNYYDFRPLQALCEECIKLTHTIKREEQQSTDPYSWLVEDDVRINLTDKETIKIYLSGHFLFELEREERINRYAVKRHLV